VGSNFSNFSGEIFQVENVIQHPKFKIRTMNYDFAIIKLANEITLEPTLKEAIPLPQADDVTGDGALAFVSGYGVTLVYSDEKNILRGVELPIVSQKVCKRSYWLLTPQMFCAGLPQGKVDACQG
jgi:trypsin